MMNALNAILLACVVAAVLAIPVIVWLRRRAASRATRDEDAKWDATDDQYADALDDLFASLGHRTWDWRVVHHEHPSGEYYHVHEVHYNADGLVEAWAASPQAPVGNDEDDLRGELRLMLEAFDKPTLRARDLPA